MTGENLGTARWHTGIEGVGDRRMAQRVGLMCRGILATFAMRVTIR